MNGKNEKQDTIEVEGLITACLPDLLFKVELENGFSILAYVSGRTRRNHIKIVLGDKVIVALSPYDLTRGRIIYRYRNHTPVKFIENQKQVK